MNPKLQETGRAILEEMAGKRNALSHTSMPSFHASADEEWQKLFFREADAPAMQAVVTEFVDLYHSLSEAHVPWDLAESGDERQAEDAPKGRQPLSTHFNTHPKTPGQQRVDGASHQEKSDAPAIRPPAPPGRRLGGERTNTEREEPDSRPPAKGAADPESKQPAKTEFPNNKTGAFGAEPGERGVHKKKTAPVEPQKPNAARSEKESAPEKQADEAAAASNGPIARQPPFSFPPAEERDDPEQEAPTFSTLGSLSGLAGSFMAKEAAENEKTASQQENNPHDVGRQVTAHQEGREQAIRRWETPETQEPLEPHNIPALPKQHHHSAAPVTPEAGAPPEPATPAPPPEEKEEKLTAQALLEELARRLNNDYERYYGEEPWL